MMDFTLEDDIPEEFKGGTLEINSEDAKQSITTSKSDSTSVSTPETGNCNNNNNSNWGNTLITTIPHCITGSMWSSKKSRNADSDKVLQPSIASLATDSASDFFTFREGVVNKAIDECVEQFLDLEADGPLLATFLLTEINLWDSDKERLLLLTPNTLVNVKYDFIALKRIEYKKLPLNLIDTVIIGDLVYPNASLIPRINGLADGLSDVLQNCLFDRWSKSGGERTIPNVFPTRDRNVRGVRLMWNKGKPLNFGFKWNPFSNSVPFCTFTFHPLYFHKDCTNETQKKMHNIEEFIEKICDQITALQRSRPNNNETCMIHHKNILLESYIGIGSIIHNRNALGFYKVRGKFSF